MRRPRGSRPQAFRYLCVYPQYPLPKLEFLAQLFISLRDREAAVLEVALPQWEDARIYNTC